MTHTAGPWSARGTGRNWMIRNGAGNVAQTLPRPEFGQEAANARLIAKAPEMYEFIEKFLQLDKFGGLDSLPIPLVNHARRIKAEIDGSQEG